MPCIDELPNLIHDQHKMGSPENKEVKAYYDKYVDRQLAAAYNHRHLLMYDKLIAYGLTTDHHVLEVGCGVGVITSLIAKRVKKGKIVSYDLSESSIENARKRNQGFSNVTHHVGDITTFKADQPKFDFITLFDVLEHVPVELHPLAFQQLRSMAHSNTILLMNLPSKEALQYVHQHHPEQLQIIDQPLPIGQVITTAEDGGFDALQMEKYSIWKTEDYTFFAFKAHSEYVPKDITPEGWGLWKRFSFKFLQ